MHQIDIETVLKEFYAVSACRVALLDPDYNEIAAYPKQSAPFCAAVYACPQAYLALQKQTYEELAAVRQTGEASVFRCPLGLMKAIAPLYGGGVLTGYLLVGEILDDSPDAQAESLRRAAQLCGEDPVAQDVQEALAQLPAITPERFASFVTVAQIGAEYATQSPWAHPPVPTLAQSIRQYVLAHYVEKITLDGLCKQFLCSKSTLMNAFRAAYGTTIVGYITDVRLTYARRLLAEGELSMQRIAIMCGIADQGYFTRVFEREIGVSPTSFRRYMRGRKKRKR